VNKRGKTTLVKDHKLHNIKSFHPTQKTARLISGVDNCNVSFYLEMDSEYVISKSEGHLGLAFLQFCKKCDICSLKRSVFTGAFGKKSVI
jgi:hypothetical protein